MHYDNPTLQKCRALLQTLYAQRLKGLVLYGSCARGIERVESDIDLISSMSR
jgi:predicted nucleotidyltransferase